MLIKGGSSTRSTHASYVPELINLTFDIEHNIQLQVGCDPDHLPSERQVRADDPTNLNLLLQV